MPRYGFDEPLGSVQAGWCRPPGCRPYWIARQAVGGRVGATAFRQAVDALLAEGRLIEATLRPRGRRAAPHVLLLPGHAAALGGRRVASARGRRDILEAEPWYRAVRLRGETP